MMKENSYLSKIKTDMIILSSEFKEGTFQTDYIRKKISGNRRERYGTRKKFQSNDAQITSPITKTRNLK